MELLLNRRTVRGVTRYLVRWRGHTSADDEWLREEELVHYRETARRWRRMMPPSPSSCGSPGRTAVAARRRAPTPPSRRRRPPPAAPSLVVDLPPRWPRAPPYWRQDGAVLLGAVLLAIAGSWDGGSPTWSGTALGRLAQAARCRLARAGWPLGPAVPDVCCFDELDHHNGLTGKAGLKRYISIARYARASPSLRWTRSASRGDEKLYFWWI